MVNRSIPSSIDGPFNKQAHKAPRLNTNQTETPEILRRFHLIFWQPHGGTKNSAFYKQDCKRLHLFYILPYMPSYCIEKIAFSISGITTIPSSKGATRDQVPGNTLFLYVQVLIGITLGVLIGHFYPDTGVALKPLGDGFIKLIKMTIAPDYLWHHCGGHCPYGRYESREDK